MVSKRSSISKVSHFLGEDELVRVKGRLDNAPSLLYDERRPVLLPKGHFSPVDTFTTQANETRRSGDFNYGHEK